MNNKIYLVVLLFLILMAYKINGMNVLNNDDCPIEPPEEETCPN